MKILKQDFMWLTWYISSTYSLYGKGDNSEAKHKESDERAHLMLL